MAGAPGVFFAVRADFDIDEDWLAHVICSKILGFLSNFYDLYNFRSISLFQYQFYLISLIYYGQL